MSNFTEKITIMEKLFLLDAYALIYRAYYAMIKAPRINSKGLNTSAILGFVNTLQEILTKEQPTHIGVAFDPKGGSFRNKLYEQYKAQREETPEVIRQSVPLIKDIIRAYNIPLLEVEGFEADDVIGTLSYKADTLGINTYMLTPDKDYCQLVTDNTRIFRPRFGDKGYEVLDTSAVLEKYGIVKTSQIRDLLGLMGDSSDNIPGCPGVGPKTAQKLVEEFGSIENLLDNTDKLKGSLKEKIEKNSDNIRFSKMLATIRTDVPIELDMESLLRKKPDLEKLKELLEELEMRGLLNRILKELNSTSSTEESRHVLADLFASEDTSVSKNSILSGVAVVPYDFHLIENEDNIKHIESEIIAVGKFAFSADMTPGAAVSAKLSGIALSTELGKAWYLPAPEDEANYSRFVRFVKSVMENESIAKTCHNLKPVIIALKSMDITVRGILFDTMVAHYVLQPEQNHSLENLSQSFLHEPLTVDEGTNLQETQQGVLFFKPDTDKLCDNSCRRAVATFRLEQMLSDALDKDGTTHLFKNIEMPLLTVLAEMESIGVRIDTQALRESGKMFGERLRRTEEEIFSLTGFSFNILSPKQVGEVLFDRLKITDKAKKTKNGQYVTSEEVLEGLRDKHPVVEKILQYRGLKKLIGTYVEALPALVNPMTGKIHSSFNQTVTATGRLSSSNPNLQNIPVRDEDGKEVRKAFIPDPGCRFFSADYSQIELRIMAHLSGDRNMREDFEQGHDIHTATAAKIFHKNISEVTRSERSKAKTANFGIIYGISAFGLAERMKVSRSEAKELIDNYFKTYPDIRNFIDRQISEARSKGYIQTIMNRKRYLPDITSHNATVRGYAERNAVNAPIQGSAADIIKLAMVNISRRFKTEGLKSSMILQVHDELNFNVVPGEEEAVKNIVTTEMQNAFPMSVPLTADCGWGTNWLEAH